MGKQVVARWESRRGKWWLEAIKHEENMYTISQNNGIRVRPYTSEEDVIKECEYIAHIAAVVDGIKMKRVI